MSFAITNFISIFQVLMCVFHLQ